MRVRSGESFSKVVGVSEGVGEAVGDRSGLSAGGVVVERMEVMRVWNRRGVMVAVGSCVGGSWWVVMVVWRMIRTG